jgi:ABC-type transporter Mla MlaB component
MLTDTPCQITVNAEEGQPPTLVLRGDLTIYQADPLYEATIALLQEEADVVVSCREVVHLDTAVLQILLVLQCELHARGRRLRLAGVSLGLGELLELAGVNDTLMQSPGRKPDRSAACATRSSHGTDGALC